MDEPSLLPDGPPLSDRELARYRVTLADGIDEGYAAIYRAGTLPELVTVYASESATVSALMRSEIGARRRMKKALGLRLDGLLRWLPVMARALRQSLTT